MSIHIDVDRLSLLKKQALGYRWRGVEKEVTIKVCSNGLIDTAFSEVSEID
jgi:hypothetical protein